MDEVFLEKVPTTILQQDELGLPEDLFLDTFLGNIGSFDLYILKEVSLLA